MKKQGFFAGFIRDVVEEERKKYAGRPPEPFMNEKKQMWYFLMNQIDGDAENAEAANEEDKPE